MLKKFHGKMHMKIRQLAPGILLALIVMFLGYGVSQAIGKVLPIDTNPISPLLLTIIFGLLVRNIMKLPPIFFQGISFCIKKVLRFGIIIMGIKLSIVEIA